MGDSRNLKQCISSAPAALNKSPCYTHDTGRDDVRPFSTFAAFNMTHAEAQQRPFLRLCDQDALTPAARGRSQPRSKGPSTALNNMNRAERRKPEKNNENKNHGK